MKNKLFFALSFLLMLPGLSSQSISLSFSDLPTNAADGFLNNTLANGGVASNEMPWGIVVDTSGGTTGFSSLLSGTLSSFNINSSGQFIAPDLFYLFGTTPTPPVTIGGFGSNGIITAMNSVPYENLQSNDPFSVVWFPEPVAPGSRYGVLAATAFKIPSAGDTASYATLPIFDGTGQFEAGEMFLVPEPEQAALILSLLALGIVFYRRKSR